MPPRKDPDGPVQGASTRDRAVQELHAKGLGRNEIAAELGIGKATVTRTAEKLGLSFDREATRAAVSARQDDLAERRSRLLDGMYAQTEALLGRLADPAGFETILRASFGEEKPRKLGFIPTRDVKDLAAAAAQLALAANRLEQSNSPQADKVKGLLGGIADQLGIM